VAAPIKKDPTSAIYPLIRKTPVKKPQVKRKPAVKNKKTNRGWPVQLKVAIAGLVLILLSPFYYGYVLKCAVSSWRWIKDIGSGSNYRTYKGFNIRIPDNYTIHGIDVSRYQDKIDWPQVKAMEDDGVHITFAFIKATEGILIVDPYFQRNWREAPKAGITCGAYHYFRPKVSGKWQARFFLQTVKIEKGDLPLVVDVEEMDGVAPEKMRAELQDFLTLVETKTKVKPMIYSGLSFYQDYLQGYFDSYTLWIAHYYQPELKIASGTNWKFWQHSDKAKVNGIDYKVDFNVFNGDSVAFSKMLVK
jgi:lysozyme